jgi:hypothetical protein
MSEAISPDSYPGSGRVLVIGLSPQVNRSVVEPLIERGVNARGLTRPLEAVELLDARDFDLIVFGRGVLGPLGNRLKRSFLTQNPDIRFVEVIAPVAVRQTLAALAHDPRVPRYVTEVAAVYEGWGIQVRATILASCHLTLTLFCVVEEGLLSEQLMEDDVEPGPLNWTTPVTASSANSLLLTADESEYQLYPFVDA